MVIKGDNFEVYEPKSSMVVGLLEAEAKDFFHSEEYKSLNGYADDLPGALAAVFARFLTRLTRSVSPERLSPYLSILEKLADWHDAEVDDLLRDEVFWAISLDPIGSEKLKSSMKGRLLEMYGDWQSEDDF